MVGFLTGLGDIAAGFSQGISPYLQYKLQSPGDAALGSAIMSEYGVTPPPQQGGLGGIMSNIFGGGGQQPAAVEAIPPIQPGVARSPQPPIAQPGGGLPTQTAQAAPQPPQSPPAMPTPPPQAQPAQARPQPQQEAPGGRGPFDLDRLTGALARTPGMTPQKLGRIVQSPGFTKLLSAQGLAQYRALRGADILRQYDPALPGSRAFGQETAREGVGERVRHDKTQEGLSAAKEAGVKERFDIRIKTAAEKLKNATTAKQEADAKKDLDKAASELKTEMQSNLNIANAPDTPDEDKQAAIKRAVEINKQLEEATNAAVQAHRSGGQPQGGGPVQVQSSAEAFKLPKGTHYVTPDGQEYER